MQVSLKWWNGTRILSAIDLLWKNEICYDGIFKRHLTDFPIRRLSFLITDTRLEYIFGDGLKFFYLSFSERSKSHYILPKKTHTLIWLRRFSFPANFFGQSSPSYSCAWFLVSKHYDFSIMMPSKIELIFWFIIDEIFPTWLEIFNCLIYFPIFSYLLTFPAKYLHSFKFAQTGYPGREKESSPMVGYTYARHSCLR